MQLQITMAVVVELVDTPDCESGPCGFKSRRSPSWKKVPSYHINILNREKNMNRAQRRKFHYIYKITNILNEKFYIGMHSTDDLKDGYFGSGKYLWYSVQKHGKENHSLDILEYCENREELAKREAEIVTLNLLNDPKCMNIRLGGEGGWDHQNRIFAVQSAKAVKANEKMKLLAENSEWSEAKSKKISSSLVEQHATGIRNIEALDECRSRAWNESGRTKRKEKQKEIGFQQGENNSQFGLVWIAHELFGPKKCKKGLLPEYIEQGWLQGRGMKRFFNDGCVAE